MSTDKSPNLSREARATARLDRKTKERIQKLVEKYPTLDESDIIRFGLELVLPKLEAGKLPKVAA